MDLTLAELPWYFWVFASALIWMLGGQVGVLFERRAWRFHESAHQAWRESERARVAVQHERDRALLAVLESASAHGGSIQAAIGDCERMPDSACSRLCHPGEGDRAQYCVANRLATIRANVLTKEVVAADPPVVGRPAWERLLND